MGVGVGEGVDVAAGPSVGVSVAVGVADGVAVDVAVGISVTVEVGVGVPVAVAVMVGDAVGVADGVGVAVEIAVGVGLPALPALKISWTSALVKARLKTSTSSTRPGRYAPSRELEPIRRLASWLSVKIGSAFVSSGTPFT